MNGLHRKSLQIVVEDTDRWDDQALYEAIVRLLARRGVAGATVWSGLMGYGASMHIHRKGLFGIADEKPVVIMAIDTEEAIRSVLPEVLEMIQEGIVVLQDAEVFVKHP